VVREDDLVVLVDDEHSLRHAVEDGAQLLLLAGGLGDATGTARSSSGERARTRSSGR
jgi:hypothetical protein